MSQVIPNCGLCKHAVSKKTLFGKNRNVCSINGKDVEWGKSCSQFLYEVEKLLALVNLRKHVHGSGECCAFCRHDNSNWNLPVAKREPYCDKLRVKFPKGFDEWQHTCDCYRPMVGGDDD